MAARPVTTTESAAIPVTTPSGTPAAGIGRVLGRHLRRFGRIAAAFVLVLVGAVFVITPLIPGWPLMVVGLSLLAPDFAWARRLLERFPQPRRNKKKD